MNVNLFYMPKLQFVVPPSPKYNFVKVVRRKNTSFWKEKSERRKAGRREGMKKEKRNERKKGRRERKKEKKRERRNVNLYCMPKLRFVIPPPHTHTKLQHFDQNFSNRGKEGNEECRWGGGRGTINTNHKFTK